MHETDLKKQKTDLRQYTFTKYREKKHTVLLNQTLFDSFCEIH